MSLNGALSNAVSGLAANTRAAGVVSSNLANSLTEGYGRRDLIVTSSVTSSYGGVQVEGISRRSDPVLAAESRLAQAASGQATVLQAFHSSMELEFKTSTDEDSLVGRLSQFETSLITAAADPSSSQRLTNVSQSAGALATRLNTVSNTVQASRVNAEAEISQFIEDLNQNLSRVQDLNTKISAALNTNQDTSALMDQRQLAIDNISEIVPVRTMPRDRDAVALISTGGAILLDGNRAEIGLIRSNEIAPHMTMENGQLSQLTMNGRTLNSDPGGPMSGGKLGAQLTIRDVAAIDVQNRLDALALDLASGFGPGGPDTTLSSGDSGLFTDFGAPVTSAGEIGLAQRLQLNDLVEPGAEVWRLRDGLGASVPGPVGDATLLNSLQTQLTISTDPASPNLPDSRQTIFTRFAEATSWISDSRVDADQQAVFSMSQSTALTEMQLAQSVDTDVELEWLMRIEQAYAANAKVLSVVDELMQRILAI